MRRVISSRPRLSLPMPSWMPAAGHCGHGSDDHVLGRRGTGSAGSLGAGDSDPNGLFARILIKELDNPEVPAHQMAKNIRNEVVALAQSVHREQVPALYDQSIGEFWLCPDSTDGSWIT
jgi:hypothetical protein